MRRRIVILPLEDCFVACIVEAPRNGGFLLNHEGHEDHEETRKSRCCTIDFPQKNKKMQDSSAKTNDGKSMLFFVRFVVIDHLVVGKLRQALRGL
ncbi:MAG: hypothetical protein HGA84_08115 [Syntrophobacteraceae bacterium]|nr:hypothetical protein [Syntrophobacteraceae bacterium]